MGKKSSRVLLQSSNALAMIIGLGSIGTALWLIFTNITTSFVQLIEWSTPLTSAGIQQVATGLVLSLQLIAEFVLLGSGVMYVPVVLFGQSGLKRNNRGHLIAASFFAALAAGAELTTGILVLVSSQTMPEQLENYLLYTLNNTFDGLANSTNSISIAWYNAMQQYDCCGYWNISDFLVNYATMAWYWKQLGPYYFKNGVTKNTANVPPCCCVFDSGDGRNMDQMLDTNCARLPNPSVAFYNGCGTYIYQEVYLSQSVLLYVGFITGGLTIVMAAMPVQYIKYLPKKSKPKKIIPAKRAKYMSNSYGRGG